MSLELTKRIVYESDVKLIPKPIGVDVRSVLQKMFDENIILHEQSPNSYNLHLYHQ